MSRRLTLLIELRRSLRRERVFRDRRNPLDIFTDEELVQRYRFSRAGIMYIADIITESIEHKTRRNQALLPYQQVVIALQYYATGTFQLVVGDALQVTQPTACRAIHRVTNALVRKLNEYVAFPEDEQQLARIKDGFHRMKSFPGVIGCVDGTHVWITAPRENKADYLNRKGYHSINVQVICDHRGKFTNIVAKWPGGTHDSRVLRNSQFWESMEAAGNVNGLILGDSGYPCRGWLLTPLLNPRTSAERRYNYAHKATRVLIEQTIGRWKRRFHILHLENRLKSVESICRVIGATAMLHNIAIDLKEAEVDDIDPGQPQPDDEDFEGVSGTAMRNHLIQTRFQH